MNYAKTYFQIVLFIFVVACLSHAKPICVKSASQHCFTDPFPATTSTNPLDIYDHATKLVSECYYDQSFSGIDWEQKVIEGRKTLNASSLGPELVSNLSMLIKGLGTSHTEFLTSADQRYWALKAVFSRSIDGAKFSHIGATFVRASKKWFVVSVFEGSPAWKASLRRGDEILSVDSKPLEPVESFNDPKQCRLVRFQKGKVGPVQSVCIKPKIEGIQRTMLEASKLSARIFTLKGKKIGYFHLWAGTHQKFKEVLHTTISSMNNKIDALILDIRGGLGGAGESFISPFFDSTFTKPLVLIIDSRTASGKETLAHLLKTRKRATLVGANTAGAYLGGRLFDISPSSYALFLAICGDSPVGVDLEGVGVPPDIPVSYPLEYTHGKDPLLSKALQVAAAK